MNPKHLVLATYAFVMPASGCGTDPSDTSSTPCSGIAPPCDVPGAIICSEDNASVIECRSSGNGCWVWMTRSACGSFGSCVDGFCVCLDACGPLNQLRCAGDTIELCRPDPFGCLYWEEIARCADLGKTCTGEGSTVACTGGCDVDGQVRCSGDVIETCTQNAQGFLDWHVVVDCALNEQACSDAGGVVECVNP